MDLFIKEGQGFQSGFRKCTDYSLQESLRRAFGSDNLIKGMCGRTNPMEDKNSKVYRIVEVIGYNDNFPGIEVYVERVSSPPRVFK